MKTQKNAPIGFECYVLTYVAASSNHSESKYNRLIHPLELLFIRTNIPLKEEKSKQILCCFLTNNLERNVLVAVLVVILAGAVIAAGVYFIISNLITYTQTSPPTTVMPALNWGGYVVASDLQNPQTVVAGVNGSWIVPSLTDIGTDAFSAVWVGIGGQYSKSLVQIGTEQDFIGGVAQYSAWYETLPNESVTIDSMQISPGDYMQASVVLTDPISNLWALNIADLSTGQTFQIHVAYSSDQLTAEWIVERPDVNGAVSVLADFGSVTFTNCTANLGSYGV